MLRSRSAGVAGLALVIGLSSTASEGAPPDLHTRLDAKRRALGRVGDQAKVLTQRIAQDGRRIDQLQAELIDARRRLVAVDARLARRRVELDRVQQARRRETARRLQLVRRLTDARRVLADRLVAVYKADDPDVINVVFRAESLADVFARTDFIMRVGAQDRRILERVRLARADAIRSELQLRTLSIRTARTVRAIETERRRAAVLADGLAMTTKRLRIARAARARSLTGVRSDERELRGQVAALERENARVEARLARTTSTDGDTAPSGSQLAAPTPGRLQWPRSPATC